MSIFDSLEKIYSEIDGNYSKIELIAHTRNHYKKEKEYFLKRSFNNHAYFLFMFSRFEDFVRNLSNKLIDNKMSNDADWKSKRTWEIINKQKANDTLHFMNRVALLTAKDGADYNLIKRFYDQRNEIAHGGSFTIAISMPIVF